MSLPAGVVSRMIAHGVRASDPFHKAAHFAVEQGTQHQVPVVVHELVAMQLHLIQLQRLPLDRFKRQVVLILVKDRGAEMRPVEGVIVAPASSARAGLPPEKEA